MCRGWDWRAVKRIRVKLWLIGLAAAVVGVSEVYADSATGQPFDPFPAVVALCTVLVAVIGLMTSWVKRIEKRSVAQAPAPANGERFGHVHGTLESMEKHNQALQKLVLDHREETVRELGEVKADVLGAVGNLRTELQAMDSRQAEAFLENIKAINFQVRNIQERVEMLEKKSAA